MLKKAFALIFPLFLFLAAHALSVEDEQALAHRIIDKVGFAQLGTDAEGHVTGLFLTYRGGVYKDVPEWLGEHVVEIDNNKGGPQLTDEDIDLLFQLPHLKFLKLEGQLITDEGYMRFADMKRLEYLGLHKIDREEVQAHGRVSGDSIRVFNELPNLRRFDYKHNFRIDSAPVEELRGSDKLEYLMLDNALSYPSVIPFVKACPNLKVLQFHRTYIRPEDLREVVSTNRKVEEFHLRPDDEKHLQPEDLSIVADWPVLRDFRFGLRYNNMDFDYEDLAFLTRMDSLRAITGPVKKKEDPAFHELVGNLPDGVEFQYRFW